MGRRNYLVCVVRQGFMTLGALLLVAGTSQAAEWYVRAKAKDGGTGTRNQPFSSLYQAESASQPGDTIYILQSPAADVLDGGIQLKDGQRLIGLGPNVTRANAHSARATLTNSRRAVYDGDIVRLAKHNVIENIHFDHANRSSIFGINADGAVIRDNLITNDMAVHDLFAIEGPAPSTCRAAGTPPAVACPGEWPNGYILFAPQTNHFGAITLVACGPHARVLSPRPDILLRPISYCEFLVPGSGTIDVPVDTEITGNTIRDGNSDGLMLINDTGVVANMRIDRNTVRDLSQPLPDPSSVGSTDHVVRSRAITFITIDRSVLNLELANFVGSNLSPFGTFAADGIVFLDCGTAADGVHGPIANAHITDVLIENPLLSGDTSNGDSIEIQHRGSTNGELHILIERATLMDGASTNIKLIESTNPDNGIYDVTVKDSVLFNRNTAGNEDAQIRYLGTQRTSTKALWLTLDNVQITGVGRGVGLTVAAAPPSRTINANPIRSFHVMIQNSSLSELTGEAISWWQAASAQLGTLADPPVIDLGGGPFGSRGNNRFVHNGDPAYVPPGADATAIDPHGFDADISASNARPAPANPPLSIYADNNYWGGGAPSASGTVTGGAVYLPTGTNVTFTAPTHLVDDPRP